MSHKIATLPEGHMHTIAKELYILWRKMAISLAAQNYGPACMEMIHFNR
jgi:hypothetical protein